VFDGSHALHAPPRQPYVHCVSVVAVPEALHVRRVSASLHVTLSGSQMLQMPSPLQPKSQSTVSEPVPSDLQRDWCIESEQPMTAPGEQLLHCPAVALVVVQPFGQSVSCCALPWVSQLRIVSASTQNEMLGSQ
jgi:hypothetical protein